MPDIHFLLSLNDESSVQQVMSAACEVRYKYFGSKIFLYGFVYFTTYCRNSCTFCFYRQGNNFSPRYRKSVAETISIAAELKKAGVHLIDLTMGEDPEIHDAGNYQAIIDLIEAVHNEVKLPIMISPGVVPEKVLHQFESAGADWYAAYQETHTPSLYESLRINQSFQERVLLREQAKAVGLLVEDGILMGVGETIGDRVNSIMCMKKQGVHQVRVMSFVPQAGTPLENRKTPQRSEELLTIAVMRLVFQDRLIPASLDVDGLAGLESRLLAGANVVTSIIPPKSGLAGVSQSSLDIEEGYRNVEGVRSVLSNLGLRVADSQEYLDWLCIQKIMRKRRCQ